jgi:hypothetical protein
MSRMLMFAVVGATATLTLAASAAAQNERYWNYHGWRTIAYQTVRGGTDTDRIYVRGRERFNNVRLCSMNAPIRMRDFDIYFANGQRQDVNVRERIAPGTCTRAVNMLGSDRRDITLIRLKYEPITRSMQRPLVRVQVR